MNAEVAAVCNNVLAALLNGTAQGTLLILALAGTLRLFRRMNAATRHGLEFMMLAVLVVVPVAHFLSQMLPHSNSLNRALDLPAVRTEQLLFSPQPPSSGARRAEAGLISTISLPPYLSVSVVLIGAMLATLRVVFLGVQLCTLRRWKQHGSNAAEPVRELFSKLCVELKVSRAPQLRTVGKISAPMAVGFKQPAVLLPAALAGGVSDARLEQVLRHELAHVVRRDDWANLFQQIARAIFFFHPGVIWVSRRMTVDREIACDDHVLSAVADRKAYALALAELATRKQRRNMSAALAAWGSQSQLKQRINMILDTKRNHSPRVARGKTGLLAAAAMLVAVLAFQAVPRVALGEGAVEAPPAEPAVPAEAGPSTGVSVATGPVRVAAAPPTVVLDHVPAAKPGVVAIAGNVPQAVLAAPGGGVMYAGALPPGEEDGNAPGAKARAEGRGDDLERRMERLEKMVESIRRDTEKRKFRFESQNKLTPPNFGWNGPEFAQLYEKVAKDAEKAARNAAKQAEKFKDFQGDEDFNGLPGEDNLNIRRKTLEEQKRALEQQVRSLQRQIEKLERVQQDKEHDFERARERQDREVGRAGEKARRDAPGDAKETNGESR